MLVTAKLHDMTIDVLASKSTELKCNEWVMIRTLTQSSHLRDRFVRVTLLKSDCEAR